MTDRTLLEAVRELVKRARIEAQVLRLIGEGYPAKSQHDHFVLVENPGFQPDNGGNPLLVVDTHKLAVVALSARVTELDRECQLSMATIAEERARAEKAEAELTRLSARIATAHDEALDRETIGRILYVQWCCDGDAEPAEQNRPNWQAWKSDGDLNPVGLKPESFRESADFLIRALKEGKQP